MSDTIASAAGQLGQSTGASNLGQGVADLFSGGSQTPAAGQPGAPELVGPPSPVASPSFLQGFAQGFMGMQPNKGADTPMGAGGAIGGGIGQLVNAINQLRNPGGMVEQQIVNLAGLPKVPSVDVAPGYKPAAQPSNIIQGLLSSYTGGLLGSNKMGG